MTTTKQQRAAVRDYLNLSNHNRYPIQVIDGSSPPKRCGRSYYWTTPSGKTEVRHPNAYGWRVVYHASSLHVTVGRCWLEAYDRCMDGTPWQIIQGMATDIEMSSECVCELVG